MLAKWGVKVDDVDAELRRMDVDHGGRVLFDEFSGWALKHGLDLWNGRRRPSTLLGDVDLSELDKQHKSAREAAFRHGGRSLVRKLDAPARTLPELLELSAETLTSELIARLPCGRSETDRAARDGLW
eukprot:3151444-Prymnesium_polylepis.1